MSSRSKSWRGFRDRELKIRSISRSQTPKKIVIEGQGNLVEVILQWINLAMVAEKLKMML